MRCWTGPSRTERINRIGWTAALTFLAYGRRIGVRVNDPHVLKVLPKHLPYGWKPAEGPAQDRKVERLYSLFTSGREHNPKSRRSHRVFAGAVELARSLQLDEVLEAFERDARMFIAEHARLPDREDSLSEALPQDRPSAVGAVLLLFCARCRVQAGSQWHQLRAYVL